MRPFPPANEMAPQPGIWLGKSIERGSRPPTDVFLTLQGSPVVVVVGARGTGKTTLLKSIATRKPIGLSTGQPIVLVVDLQGNWRQDQDPANNITRLALGTEPPNGYTGAHIPIRALTPEDWAALLGINPTPSESQWRILSGALESLRSPFSFSELQEEIELSDGHPLSLEALRMKLIHLKRFGLIEDDLRSTTLQLEEMRGITVVDAAGYGREVGVGVSLVLARWVARWARVKSSQFDGVGLYPLVVLILDEGHLGFQTTSSSEAWENLALTCREWGVCMVLASQRPSTLPLSVRTQAEVWIAGGLRHEVDIRQAAQAFTDSSYGHLKKRLSELQTGEFLARGLWATHSSTQAFTHLSN